MLWIQGLKMEVLQGLGTMDKVLETGVIRWMESQLAGQENQFESHLGKF